MHTGLRAQVIEFLLHVKQTIQKGSESWVFVTRLKNTNAIAALEFTVDDVRREILALSVTDYCDGPVDDPAISGQVWIFGKHVQGKEIYIRLKLQGDKTGLIVRILSFHFARKPLIYKFKV